MADEKRDRGFVIFFNATKGFGFIKPHGDDKEDLFVHQSAIESNGFRTLFPDQEVEFDYVLDKDGSVKAGFVTLPGGAAFDPPARRRPGNGRRSNGNECFNCGGVGHRKWECPSQPLLVDGGDRACRNCGQQGHFAKECTGGRGVGGGGGGGRTCYTCGDPAHLARDCPRGGDGGVGAGGGRTCYTCGDPAHIARDCPRGGDGGVGGGGGRTCYTCGAPTHFARDCPSGGGERKRQEIRCFRCKKTGHKEIDCKEEDLVGDAWF